MKMMQQFHSHLKNNHNLHVRHIELATIWLPHSSGSLTACWKAPWVKRLGLPSSHLHHGLIHHHSSSHGHSHAPATSWWTITHSCNRKQIHLLCVCHFDRKPCKLSQGKANSLGENLLTAGGSRPWFIPHDGSGSLGASAASPCKCWTSVRTACRPAGAPSAIWTRLTTVGAAVRATVGTTMGAGVGHMAAGSRLTRLRFPTLLHL